MKFAKSSQSDHKNHEDFCISQWQFQTKSLSYVIYRWIVASLFCSYMAGWFIQDYINNTGILIDFIYLTNLSFLMSTVTVILSTYLATSHYNRPSYTLSEDKTKKYTLYLFEILSSISASMAIVVAVNYWLLIHNPEVNAIDFNNIVGHLMNGLILLIDILVTKQRGKFTLLVFPLMFGCIYLIFTWIYAHNGGLNKRGEEFIYSILNWNVNPQSALLVGVAVLLEVVIIHLMLTLLIKTRKWLGRKVDFSASQDCLHKEFCDIEKNIASLNS